MTPSGRRWLRGAALLAFGLLLVAFGRHVEWRTAGVAVRDADPVLLLVALVLNQLSLTLKGVRWWVLLRPLGVRSLSLVLRATFAGASLNNLVVAQGGEGARVVLVSRATGVSSAHIAGALALERVLDAVSYLTLLVGAMLVLDMPAVLTRWRMGACVALVLSIAALVALSVVSPPVARAAPARSRLHAYLHRFIASVADSGSPGRLASAMLLSLGAWGLQVATYHTIALAARLPMPVAGSVAAMLAIGVSFLIRATPGNVGVFQVIYALTAASYGVSRGPAVATALLIQTIQVLPTIVLGMLAGHGFTARRAPA